MEDKYFKRYRNLGRVAFYCTLVLSIAILLSSFMGSQSSGAITRFFESIVLFFEPEADVDHGQCSGIEFTIIDNGGQSKHYIGSVATVVVTPVPESAQIGEFTVTSSNPSVASVEGDKIYYHAYGNAEITVTLNDNPTIAKTDTTVCEGKDPNIITELVLDESCRSVKVGERKTLRLNGSVMSSAKVQVLENPDAIKIVNQFIFGMKAGEVTVRITVKDLELTETITVLENPDFTLPETIETYGSVNMWIGEKATHGNLIESPAPEDNFYFTIEIAEGYPKDVVSVGSDKNYVTAKKIGSTRIKIISVFDPQLFAYVDINVKQQPPEDMIIVGEEYVSIYGKNDSYTLRDHNGRDIANDAITWEIVSGNATVDGEGVVTVKGFRKVVIRATTVVDGFTMVTEKTVKVRLYDDFYGFMRKVAGHFAAFTLLGIGVLATATVFIKRKWLVPVITLAYDFFIAGLSEIFQLPIFVAGRCCSFTDVLLDFSGTVFGNLIFIAVFVLFIIILRIILKKDNFKIFSKAARSIGLRDIFKKRKNDKA